MKKTLEQLKREKAIMEAKLEKEITKLMFATGMTREQIEKIVDERLGINQTVH